MVKKKITSAVWEQIKILYISGQSDAETGKTVFQSHDVLGKEFGIPPSTISSRANKEHWLAQRNEIEELMLVDKHQKTVAKMKERLPDQNAQDLVILDGIIEAYVTKLLAGKIDVSTSEVIKALAFRRTITGVPEPEKPPVEVNVAVGITNLDFGLLSDKEQEILYNVITRDKLRERRDQEIDVSESTPAEFVSSVDS